MKDKKETAQEVPVQEQFIIRIIERRLKKFENYQTILLMLQTIVIITFSIMLFKEKAMMIEVSEQIKSIVDLLLRLN